MFDQNNKSGEKMAERLLENCWELCLEINKQFIRNIVITSDKAVGDRKN